MEWSIVKTGCDGILLMFLDNNKISLALLFSILLGIAKVMPGTWDEKLISAIFGPIKAMMRKK